MAAASLLMIAVLLLHGPISPDLDEQMARIAGIQDRWRLAHWLAAAGLSLYTVTGLLVLSAGSRLTSNGVTLTAWAVVTVGAMWTVTTAVAEATAVTHAVISADRDTFGAWLAFAEGKASGFAFVALAVALIAASEAGAVERTTPGWSAWLAAGAGIASFGGWALGMWLGVPPGSVIWLVSSTLMCLWTLAFGLALLRGYGRS